jgi:hypothetical protein
MDVAIEKREVDGLRHIILKNIHFIKTAALVVAKGKAGGPIRQAGQRGRRANKAGGPTRLMGQ